MKVKTTWDIFVALFKQLFIRSKESVFWLVIFPSILFMILTTIFGNVDKNINLRVAIIGESKTLSKVFENIPQLSIEFVKTENQEEQLTLLENQLKAGKTQTIVILPEDFDSKLAIASLLQRTKLQRKVDVTIYYVPLRQESKLAKEIISGVFNSIGTTTQLKYTVHKLSEGQFSYNEFIYPGVIGMAILSAFLFGFMNDIVYMHKRGILRRLYTAPVSLTTVYLLAGLISLIQLALGILVLSIFAWLKGVDVFGYLQYILVHVPIASAVLVLLSITVMSLFKSTSKIFVFEQIFFQVQMFVGGFYFPLKFANPVVKSIAKMLPLTYTIDALRLPKNLNALESGHIVVPLIYIVILSLSVAFSGKKLRIGE